MKKQENIKKLVGRIGEAYYFCDYIFEDGKNFKGATGSILRPINLEEYEGRTSIENKRDYAKEAWQQAVAEHQTEDSLDDWMEYNDYPDEEFIFDLSYPEYAEELRRIFEYSDEDYPVIECTGGGRCFDKNQKFDEVYDQKLLDRILEVEK